MEVILLVARILLVVVFGVAGIAKLADLAGSRKALTGFGVPESLAIPLGWALPILEIVIAVLLLPLATAWVGGIGALALLVIFLLGISVNLARGKVPDCHCFGQLHSEPVSGKVLARNSALAVVAALIVVQAQAQPGLSAFDWLADLKAGEIITLIISVGTLALLVPTFVVLRRVWQQQAAVLEKLDAMKKVIEEDYAEPAPIEREDAVPPVEGLPVGAPAPRFALAAASGGQISLTDLLAPRKPVLLLFVSPSCLPCKTLLPLVRVWERDYAEQLTVALLSKGTAEEIEKRIAKYGATHLLRQDESAVADEYQAKWTPAAVVIDANGKIASPMTYGDEAIRALVTHTVTTMESSASTNGNGHKPRIAVGTSLFKVGEPAPRFSLPNMQGKTIHTEDLLGRDSLLLFWDPGCPHCQAMTDDLQRWQEKTPPGAPQLVIVASGNQETIQAQEFKSLVLADPEFDIGPLFGTNSTPSAVLLDSQGRIASSLAKGEKNILALVGVRKVSLPIAARK